MWKLVNRGGSFIRGESQRMARIDTNTFIRVHSLTVLRVFNEWRELIQMGGKLGIRNEELGESQRMALIKTNIFLIFFFIRDNASLAVGEPIGKI